VSRIRILLGISKDEWAIIHFVVGFIAIPTIIDQVVKFFTH
jgi:hypothetical protein